MDDKASKTWLFFSTFCLCNPSTFSAPSFSTLSSIASISLSFFDSLCSSRCSGVRALSTTFVALVLLLLPPSSSPSSLAALFWPPPLFLRGLLFSPSSANLLSSAAAAATASCSSFHFLCISCCCCSCRAAFSALKRACSSCSLCAASPRWVSLKPGYLCPGAFFRTQTNPSSSGPCGSSAPCGGVACSCATTGAEAVGGC
mmetsp:Transcript_56709/g.133100  ORF Transcript_56709/g.133100 Transcript_56709/m.133100 type:complete len:201 (-) Transcript_56709:1925-2527(-)